VNGAAVAGGRNRSTRREREKAGGVSFVEVAGLVRALLLLFVAVSLAPVGRKRRRRVAPKVFSEKELSRLRRACAHLFVHANDHD